MARNHESTAHVLAKEKEEEIHDVPINKFLVITISGALPTNYEYPGVFSNKLRVETPGKIFFLFRPGEEVYSRDRASIGFKVGRLFSWATGVSVLEFAVPRQVLAYFITKGSCGGEMIKQDGSRLPLPIDVRRKKEYEIV